MLSRMFLRLMSFGCALALVSSNLLRAQDQTDPSAVDFARDIQPLLAQKCYACHGPDEKDRQADLRLDIESAAKKHVIVAGDPSSSEMIKRISSDDDDFRMPPPDSGKSLTPTQIEALQYWVAQGAKWSIHWSFVPPKKIGPPQVDTDWVRNPIDQFVYRRLKEQGLKPSPPAARRTLLRRVYFDLIGLPPTPEALERFLADDSDNAFEKVVDELLQSPHYGERVAIDWLDAARYADTNGYQNDFYRSMWPWRDWVIRSLNDNLPYDQFILQQIAGDLLDHPTQDQLIATGFNRNHRTVTEGGSIEEEWYVENVVDRVETTSQAFLGLTMGCARCHDHKYDPITQKEFYQFYAFFNNIDEKGVYIETRGNVPPLIQVPTPQDIAALAEFDKRIASLEQQQSSAEAKVLDLIAEWRSSQSLTKLPAPTISLVLPDLKVATDSSTQNADETAPAATYPAGTPDFTEAPCGKAIQLDGRSESHVDLGQAFQPQRDQPFAWMGWVKTEKTGAIVSKMDDAADFRGCDTILLEDLRLKVHIIHHWPDNAIAVITKTPIANGEWNHVCVSYDGSSKAAGVKVFVDGNEVELQIEHDSLSDTIETDQPLRLGRRSSSLSLTGAIGGFQLFARAITADEALNCIRQTVLKSLDANVDDKNHPVHGYLNRIVSGDLTRQLAQVRREQDEYNKNIQTTMVMREREGYRPTYRLKRGQYTTPDLSEELWPAVPSCLPQLKPNEPRNRLGLAHWMIDSDNPLVARVAVNQVWQRLFGRGLFSPDNLGLQGTPPTHPELLDWLAVRFVESGWDLKALHKLIVTSATYQQQSEFTPELLDRDPENRWLAHGARFRLSAELIRDNALAVSGLLSETIGGPSVKPYQPDGLWEELAGGANDGPYKHDVGDGLYRRSLYTYRKRTVSHPTLSTFDAPSWEICQVKRARTNTPLQSLALLNDETYVEAARQLATRMIHSGGEDAESQIKRGFALTLLREPTASELDRLLQRFQQNVSFYESDPQAANDLIHIGDSAPDQEIPASRLAAMTLTAAVLLNLDETITHE